MWSPIFPYIHPCLLVSKGWNKLSIIFCSKHQQQLYSVRSYLGLCASSDHLQSGEDTHFHKVWIIHIIGSRLYLKSSIPSGASQDVQYWVATLHLWGALPTFLFNLYTSFSHPFCLYNSFQFKNRLCIALTFKIRKQLIKLISNTVLQDKIWKFTSSVRGGNSKQTPSVFWVFGFYCL